MSQSGVAKNIFDKFPNSLEDISLGTEQNFKPSICSVYLSFLTYQVYIIMPIDVDLKKKEIDSRLPSVGVTHRMIED